VTVTPAQHNITICVIGIWHLGAVTSACLADLGYMVVGVDLDAKRVEALNQGRAPLFEPGLDEALKRNVAQERLRFTTRIQEGVRGASFVLVASDTPVDDDDDVDLSGIFTTFEALAPALERDAIIVVSSQVPVGTCEQLAKTVRRVNPMARFGIAYTPENLRLGQAITRFLRPDMLVIGADTPATAQRVQDLYAPIETTCVVMGLRSAEMVKHAINAYLATTISFANEIGNLCDEVGADALRVAQALRLDARVSPRAPLAPGLGFAGGTLARDIKALQRLGKQHGYPASLVNAVLEVNRSQNRMVVQRLKDVYPSLRGRKIGVLGLTYKAGTSTLRRSAAVEVIKALKAEGAAVTAYDPLADPEEVAHHPEIVRVASPHEAADASDALVLMTEWPEFRTLAYDQLRPRMRSPLLLDPQNFLDKDTMRTMGYTYWGMGRGGAASAEQEASV
jgi:UDPglucose 6-dehydrogenase